MSKDDPYEWCAGNQFHASEEWTSLAASLTR